MHKRSKGYYNASMKFGDYIQSQGIKRSDFARQLGVSTAYLRQMERGIRVWSPARAVHAEKLTGGRVTRQDLRPDDWQRIWPELADHQPATQGA